MFSLLFLTLAAFCQDEKDFLKVEQADIFVEYNSGRSKGTSKEGVNLYIRKKAGVESVMLVETTTDPEKKEDNLAYRAKEYNSLNGDEIRYLDGKPLTSNFAKYSLISSTVTYIPQLGQCFLIYIPPVMVYGYPWERHGEVTIQKGTFINIRTFTKKYGDYSGDFADNPYMFNFYPPEKKVEEPKESIVKKEEKTPPEEKKEGPKKVEKKVSLDSGYNPVAAQKFVEISKKGKGTITYSKGPETLPDDLVDLMDDISPKDKVDVIFALDTTGSMKDDLNALRTEWVPKLIEQLKEFGDIRLGLVCYRDYGDNYLFKNLPVKLFDFTDNIDEFIKNLNVPVIRGTEGGDVPEAVYEALFAGLSYYQWRDDAQKRIILMGDAEPHPYPRGVKKVSQDTVLNLAEEKDIQIDCIIVPNTR